MAAVGIAIVIVVLGSALALVRAIFWGYPAPLLPASLLSWLGWLVFLGLLVWLVWMWRFYQSAWDRRAWLVFISAGFLLAPSTDLCARSGVG